MENPTASPSDTVNAVSWVSYLLHFVVAVAAVLPGIQASVSCSSSRSSRIW